MSVEIMRRFPNISTTVQDMENMFEGADARISAGFEKRLKYMVHNLFASQLFKADVYFYDWAFFNWSSKHCALIIKALIPALKPRAGIIVNGTCMLDPSNISHWREK